MIINHSGNITADETWSASDEHRVTGHIYIGNPGGARVTVTVEPGATIYVWGSYCIEGRNDGTAFGAFNASGTNWTTGKITIVRGGTTEPYNQSWNGLSNRHDCNFTLRFCHVKHAQDGMYVYNDLAGGDAGDVDIQQCFFEYCWKFPSFTWIDGTSITCNFIFKKNAARCIYFPNGSGFSSNTVVAITGTWEFEQCYFWDFCTDFVKGYGPFTDDWPFAKYEKCVVRSEMRSPYLGNGFNIKLGAGGTAPDIKNCYLEGIGLYDAAIAIMSGGDTLLVEGCVLYKNNYGVRNDDNVYHGDGILKNCDFIHNANMGAQFFNGAGEGVIDGSYFERNNSRDCVEPGAGADEQQYYNMEGGVSLESTPNRPLEADNVAESGLDPYGVTITFDSKAGPNGLRCPGVAFVKYGTTSGGPYTERAGVYPDDIEELALAWCEIDGQFKETGHQVTINNLKPGTKYYYRACFIDPLGRIGVSAEGDFTTSSVGLRQGPAQGSVSRRA